MIRKSFVVVIEDDIWPNVSCTIVHLKLSDAFIDGLLMQKLSASSRESLYDTAQTNFEVHVRNALGQSMRELFNERKATPPQGAESRLGNPAQRSPIPEAGTSVPDATGTDRGGPTAETEPPRPPHVHEGVARKRKTTKKGGR